MAAMTSRFFSSSSFSPPPSPRVMMYHQRLAESRIVYKRQASRSVQMGGFVLSEPDLWSIIAFPFLSPSFGVFQSLKGGCSLWHGHVTNKALLLKIENCQQGETIGLWWYVFVEPHRMLWFIDPWYCTLHIMYGGGWWWYMTPVRLVPLTTFCCKDTFFFSFLPFSIHFPSLSLLYVVVVYLFIISSWLLPVGWKAAEMALSDGAVCVCAQPLKLFFFLLYWSAFFFLYTYEIDTKRNGRKGFLCCPYIP